MNALFTHSHPAYMTQNAMQSKMSDLKKEWQESLNSKTSEILALRTSPLDTK
jgi:hypothetical protein